MVQDPKYLMTLGWFNTALVVYGDDLYSYVVEDCCNWSIYVFVLLIATIVANKTFSSKCKNTTNIFSIRTIFKSNETKIVRFGRVKS